ncbi:purine-nucleoside phosphorylase [Skermania piniformis]|uniref:Purine nucleoside phosphorylase n=1 Tax=Skermania pinensis TaxID=39122 RepID=A0ABX8S9W7_9ACTN|nr:purine-nucleoside phosphorylase [Skermania piniformis]QXQ13355.1 purine-nucleoside phosphorylase [Skermania piniformis]
MTAATTATAEQAAAMLAERTGVARHRVAVVLGSGWQEAAAAFGDPVATVPMSELPGFGRPTAQGHRGTVLSVEVAGLPTLVLLGRNHLYEGNPPAQVAAPIAAVAAAGVDTVLLTNAAGGIRADLPVGAPVLIADHLNLTGASPLAGARFVDLVDAYDPALRRLARKIAPDLPEGVYAGLRGPQYETPAEIAMLRTLGADLVGMSTVLETIAARALGLRVLGISLVTNAAAGVTGQPLSHAEVLAEGRAAAPRLGALLRELVSRL